MILKNKIDKNAVGSDLDNLASIVMTYDKGASQRLLQLRDAIVQREYEQAWAATDIYQMINPDLIVDRYRDQESVSGCLISGLELTRNTLIFVPIFVTWLAVSQASSKYQDLLNACLKSCPDQVSQPFLYLWEQGFGGRLPDFLRLSTVGLIDAGVLFSVFMLTWIVSLFASARNRSYEKLALALHSDLMNVIAQASLCLRDKPAPLISPSTSLDEAAKQIESLARSTLDRFEDVADKIGDKFDMLTKNIEAHFADAAKEFESVALKLSEHIEEIEAGLTKQLLESDKQLKVMSALAGNVSKISVEIRSAADALENVNKELSSNLSSLIGPVKDLSKQQEALLNAANNAVSHLEEAANKFGEMDDKQEKWSKKFLDTLGTFDISINKIEGIITSIGDYNKEQQVFLTELQQRGDNLSEAIKGLNDATWAVESALDAFDQGSDNIRSIAVDLSDIQRFTSALSDNNNIRQIVDDYGQAARVIERSANTLSDAADGMYQVSKDLKDATSKLKTRLAGA